MTDAYGREVASVGEAIGTATNNVAEYRAVIRGLELAAEAGATAILVRSDSRLLVEQLSGRFKVRNSALRRLHEEASALLRQFAEVKIEHVPREFNAEADRLANEGIDRGTPDGGRTDGRAATGTLFEETDS